eukprot:gnl/TRDRNA2_/TRDRNA2_184536_c0_seq1.p1 gnl/TRDRNA2_/TRDRNA2_184536_c0~~gnl/TRDRNA2_/TRDRNA2_184536_c0_seq1.p1  ORF type:complete len:474 (+),score=89.92 gnl/TRDRNA2_/TRDRNA2_184536_c0_seq1:22-1443(+)
MPRQGSWDLLGNGGPAHGAAALVPPPPPPAYPPIGVAAAVPQAYAPPPQAPNPLIVTKGGRQTLLLENVLDSSCMKPRPTPPSAQRGPRPARGRRRSATEPIDVQQGQLSTPRLPLRPRIASAPQQGDDAAATEEADDTKSAISQLQEFIQGSKRFPVPAHCKILQWHFDTRMHEPGDGDVVHAGSLEFRAAVAFMLDGVPHHAVGTWEHSKKDAMRDAAERALGLFVSRWGEVVKPCEASSPGVRENAADALKANSLALPVQGTVDAMAMLEEFCVKMSSCHDDMAMPTPNWRYTWEGRLCQAFVEVDLMGVPHVFPGKPLPSQEEASADAARRVLWYLQCPGFESAFELDPCAVIAAAKAIPGPPQHWISGDASDTEQQVAEKKTLVMRVQNRLQQAFAGHLAAGQSTWHWEYIAKSEDGEYPKQTRATAYVPVIGQKFVGAWCRGRRAAQIDACQRISEYLDRMHPRNRG